MVRVSTSCLPSSTGLSDNYLTSLPITRFYIIEQMILYEMCLLVEVIRR